MSIVYRNLATRAYLSLPYGHRPDPGLAMVTEPLPAWMARQLVLDLEAARRRRATA